LRRAGVLGAALVIALGCGVARASAQADSAPAQQNSGQQSPSSPTQTKQPAADRGQAPANPNPNPSDKDPANPAQVVAEPTADAKKDAAKETLYKVGDWEKSWLVGAYVGRNGPLVPLSGEEREEIYLRQTFLTPGAYLKRMLVAGFYQARGSPQQWGGGIGGYGKRFASQEGQFISANSLAALADAKLRYETRYDQCRCQGFWRRSRHAIVRNFLTYNESEQEMRPQLGLYFGAFGGGLISTAWKPKPRNAFAEGSRGMLGQAAWGAVQNVFIEFALDINRKLGLERGAAK